MVKHKLHKILGFYGSEVSYCDLFYVHDMW
jgi:hypothetical protein